jgi:hypothetical protein
MVAYCFAALILFMAISVFVQDMRLEKKVDLIERLCIRLVGRVETRSLLQLRVSHRYELLQPASVSHSRREGPSSEQGSGLQLLGSLNSVDTESRRVRTKREPMLNAA